MLRQEVDIKTLNVRTEKWREMTKNDLFSNMKLLTKRVRKGIPSGMRMVIWPKLLHLQEFKKQTQQSFQELIKQKSIIQREIRLDIPRTFTQQKAQLMRTSLFNVLKALSLVYPELGYCQGMNHLSMKILETVTDDTGFEIMNYLIRTHRNVSWNYKNPSSIALQNYVLDKLMEKHLHKVRKTLMQQQIPLEAFTPKWFITLFSSTLPTELFCRVFDCFLLQGYKVIYQTALALIKINEYQILHNAVEQNLTLLMSKNQYQELNQNKFINAVYLFNIDEATVQSLQQQFMATHQEQIINWQEVSQQLYQERIREKEHMEQGRMQTIQVKQEKQEEELILFDEDGES